MARCRYLGPGNAPRIQDMEKSLICENISVAINSEDIIRPMNFLMILVSLVRKPRASKLVQLVRQRQWVAGYIVRHHSRFFLARLSGCHKIDWREHYIRCISPPSLQGGAA